MSYDITAEHRAMLFDQNRNTIYYKALADCITPESLVLDLGAGTGILGLLAAQLGAKKVICIDRSPVVKDVEKVAKLNGFTNVEVICGDIKDIELTEKADVIISVFTGNFLVTEDLLHLLFIARDKWLKPGGILLPGAATMMVAPVQSDAIHNHHISPWLTANQGATFGIDYSPLHQRAVNHVYFEQFPANKIDFLSSPAELNHMDFATASNADVDQTLSITVEKSGVFHGWLGWFSASLGAHQLNTAIDSPKMHWSQAFIPLKEPINVLEGDTIGLRLIRPEHEPFSWKTSHKDTTFSQSNWLNTPIIKAKKPLKTGA